MQEAEKSAVADKTTAYLTERFTLQILIKLNSLLMQFCKLQKDNQAYVNPSQHMAADTEPRRYQNLPHFFANYYNQTMHLILGYPDPKRLQKVFADHAKLPDCCMSFTYVLLKELANNFSTIPHVQDADRHQDLFR
jgi:hypothetical protein